MNKMVCNTKTGENPEKKHLLYIAFCDFADLHFGPNTKILSQCRAFSQYGYEVSLIGRQGMRTVLIRDEKVMRQIGRVVLELPSSRFRNLLAKQKQIRDLKKYLKGNAYDICYIRYEFSDPGFLDLLKVLRKLCGKIVLELPTYPYEDENRDNALSRVRLMIDQCYRKQLHQYIDLIVTFYAGYESIFGIPVQAIPNGFDFSTADTVKSELSEDTIPIIAVSSMRAWHGYERFLAGMRDYYRNDAEPHRNIVLHLVGNGREFEKYRTLTEEYSLQEHVIMEGAMTGKPLDALYEHCAMRIDSLARHRSGIDVLSSLKSREYGARGLPMINSCKIDIIDDDFPYLLRVPADETPIHIPDVIAFYDRCFCRGKSREDVSREIRTYVESRSGMKETLRTVITRLEQL